MTAVDRSRARRSRGWRTRSRAGSSSSASSCCRRAATTRAALVEQARQLRIHGVDFVNIPDGPRASARMSALAASLVVQQQAGIETILHYACRDRNLLGMQSDLLGAHSMGVRNLLIITGDPPRVGDYPDATAVFDVDSIGLTNVVARLNRGLDIGEQPIGQPTAFHIGVAVNPGAHRPGGRESGGSNTRSRRAPSSRSPSRSSTPPDSRTSCSGLAARASRSLPAIMPLESLRHAEFMANEVPGVRVPEAVVERMRRAETAGRAAAEGVAIARELVAEIRPLVQGLQISTAAGAVDAAPRGD